MNKTIHNIAGTLTILILIIFLIFSGLLTTIFNNIFIVLLVSTGLILFCLIVYFVLYNSIKYVVDYIKN